jgi:hypothetical protein
VNFSGRAADAQGKIITGIAGATFAIYQDQYDGTPLWMETQNVTTDAKGNYTAQLGATKPDGLPLDLFTTGNARWLGVRINGGEEQPRIMLLSVPYALKAGDAQTLGGLPASAFALAAPVVAEPSASSVAPAANSSPASPSTASDVTTSGGTVNALPLFTTATNVQNSIVTQTGTTAVNVAGKLNHPATGAATATDHVVPLPPRSINQKDRSYRMLYGSCSRTFPLPQYWGPFGAAPTHEGRLSIDDHVNSIVEV